MVDGRVINNALIVHESRLKMFVSLMCRGASILYQHEVLVCTN